ncbi:hypothetical protein HPB47_012175 [Ixodes persulcatus]|uniref:Uncharacterized protein n=1 Tax=Ixodes persulcatus TaxID=34615 RepID=A0AC60NU67_IXOPE|nr:hypothetical protein HPB47_012175 [Ixodes persulcatus]
MDATEREPTALTCVGTSAAEATFDTESMHYSDEFHQAEDPNEGWITPRKSRNQRTLPRQVNELHTVVVPIPHSLQLQDIKRYDLLPFFLAAASLPPHASEEVNIDVRLQQRVILLKTAFESSARRLSQTKRIRVRNQLHEISPYLAAPINSCKGVIHGVEAGLTTNDLMHSLESFQTTIITARMMGDTESVLITFEGAKVPRTILFRRATYRCHPHRPRALRCEKCRMYGHRTFNCPESPTFWRCPTCAAQIPHQQASHACSPRCYHCGGEHSSFDSTCPVQRQKDQACMKAAYEHRVHLRKTLPRNMQKPPAYPVQTANQKQSAAQHKTELSSSNSYQPPSLNKYHLEAQAQLKASLRNAQKPTESQTRKGMLPATATWGHASAGFSTTTRSPSSQTEDLPQQRSLLHPAALTTSQPKSDIASQEPKTTRANLTEPAPSPPSIVHTSTQRLYETGLFLPLSSLLHLHRDRQLARLSGSHQGRWILEQAGLSPIDFYLHLPASPLPSNLRFALLPRRMAPGLDDGRRDAQALHHNPPFQTQTVAYTDASILDTGTAADPPSITTLELVPIIHAIISFSQLPRTSAYTVYSDSMAAIRSLQQRQIPADLREDLDMALHSLSSSSVTIRWVPGHAGIAGNELVHQLAREFHSRAPAIPWLSPPTNDEAADVAQTHILRKIQTNTLVTPARLYLFRYRSDPSCPNCPAPYANQEHCLLHCPVAYTTSFLPNPPPPSWSAWLASPQLEDQLALRVPEGLTYIREKSTGDIGHLLNYFDCTYVNGPFRYASAPPAAASRANSSLCLTVRRRRPEFPPERWNMYDATLQNKDRTNNTCEGWNIGFQKLVSHAHPSVWRLTERLQKNQELLAMAMTQARRVSFCSWNSFKSGKRELKPAVTTVTTTTSV